METRTFGKTIAILRKTAGMTQKELAEKLNISDKTVSRWERNEGTPDLFLIPVIAALFHVSCDELLRGECVSTEERAQLTEREEETPDRVNHVFLTVILSRYQTQSFCVMGLALVGWIVALICNLAFLKAVLGALIGMLFIVAAVICQVIFINRVVHSVETGDWDQEEASVYQRKLVSTAEAVFGVTAGIMGFIAPMLFTGAYLGLTLESMLLLGVAGACIALVIYGVACYVVNPKLWKKDRYRMDEEEWAAYGKKHRRKGKIAAALTAAVLLTFVAQAVTTEIWGPRSIMKGTTFYDYESFVDFMEEDVPAPYQSGPAAPVADQYLDEFGNEITEEEAYRRTLTDENGTVFCEYIERNHGVCSIRYASHDDGILPITVSTYSDLQQAEQIAAVRTVLFYIAYAVEIVGAVLIYWKTKEK